MTPEQARGLQAVVKLLNGALERLPREDARSFIDGLEHEELADVMSAASAAGVATGTGGNLFYESAAARLRARAPFPAAMTSDELLKAQGFPPGFELVRTSKRFSRPPKSARSQR